MEERPETENVAEGETPDFTGAEVKKLSFSYGEEEILHDLSASFPKGQIIAVTGRSGSGKSTLLKLLMRFWSAPEGSVLVSGTDVGRIQTAHMRKLESYMIQDTDLFHDSIAYNIRIGKLDATQEEIEAAAKKASIHDFTAAYLAVKGCRASHDRGIVPGHSLPEHQTVFTHDITPLLVSNY